MDEPGVVTEQEIIDEFGVETLAMINNEPTAS
jgi:hypothetical protein